MTVSYHIQCIRSVSHEWFGFVAGFGIGKVSSKIYIEEFVHFASRANVIDFNRHANSTTAGITPHFISIR